MGAFRYTALNPEGSEVSGTHQSASRDSAFSELRARGLTPLSITPVRKRRGGRSSGPVRRRPLTNAIRQLATLLSAGVPLLDAMESLEGAADARVADRAARLRRHLREGRSLSSGFEEHVPELPGYVAGLASLGEATGQLAQSLRDASERMADENRVASEIRSALAYPAVLACVGGAIVIFMFIFVVPRFGTLIDQSDADVPAISRQVIAAGVWMRANWLAFLVGSAGLVFLAGALGRRAGAAPLRSAARRLPVVGRMLHQAELANWARTLGIALQNGAPMMTALALSQKAAASRVFAAQLDGVRRDVRAGQALDEAFEKNVPVSDATLLDLMRTGRRSGSLDTMLQLVADLHEEEFRETTKRVTAIAEPLAILTLSLVVGALVVSIVLAMTSVYQFDF